MSQPKIKGDQLDSATLGTTVALELFKTDVVVGSPLITGEVLTYTGSPLAWRNVPGSGGSPEAASFGLGALLDVNIAGASNNDLLYRSGGNWIDTNGLLTWDGSQLTAPTINLQSVATFTTTETIVAGSPVVQTVIASHSIATYRSVEYQIQAVRGNNFHSTKILAIRGGSPEFADFTEFGTITIPSFFGSPAAGSPTISGVQATFDVDVSGGNLRLLATPVDATGNITFKVLSNLITV